MLVMIVDDSRSSLMHLQRLIERSSADRTEIFGEPEDALDAAAARKFDVVIVDYIMPKVDGIAFIRRRREMRSYAQVPIVILTASDSEDVPLEALEAGATDFIAKSFDSLELSVKLNHDDDYSRSRTIDDQCRSPPRRDHGRVRMGTSTARPSAGKPLTRRRRGCWKRCGSLNGDAAMACDVRLRHSDWLAFMEARSHSMAPPPSSQANTPSLASGIVMPAK